VETVEANRLQVVRIRLKDGVPTGEYEICHRFVVNDSEVWAAVGVTVGATARCWSRRTQRTICDQVSLTIPRAC